jgi:hypothetical protein
MLRGEPPRLLIRRFLLEPDAPESVVEEVAAAVREVASEVLACRLKATLNIDASRGFRSCATPLLCIHAAQERLLDRSVARSMKRLRPDIAHVDLGAPHLILQRRSVEAARLLERFIWEAADAADQIGTVSAGS